MLVIDPNGEKLGVLELHQALYKAKQYGLDLVEVSPRSNPPVCKILDYGKFKYEMSKKDKEARKHNTSQKVKELKFHLNIDGGDYMTKVKRAEEFMSKGMKVKLMMVFRGREMGKKGMGFELVNKLKSDLEHVGSADFEPKMIGRNINLMLTPLPAKKRKLKYTEVEPEAEDEVSVSSEAASVEKAPLNGAQTKG